MGRFSMMPPCVMKWLFEQLASECLRHGFVSSGRTGRIGIPGGTCGDAGSTSRARLRSFSSEALVDGWYLACL